MIRLPVQVAGMDGMLIMINALLVVVIVSLQLIQHVIHLLANVREPVK